MDLVIQLLILMGLAGTLFYLFWTNSTNKSERKSSDETLKLQLQLNEQLRNEIQEIRKEVNENAEKGRVEIESKLKDINKEINDFHKASKSDMHKQFSESTKVISEVTKELEKIKGTNEQVFNFANQMKSLEKILSNQKQRGILGEIQLENLLANVLPPELFQMQYKFPNGEIVDAIV